MFINQILEPDRIEDVIEEEWFQPVQLIEAPDCLAEWHESIAGREERSQGQWTKFDGKRWFVANAQSQQEAFQFIAQAEIGFNPDPVDWPAVLGEIVKRRKSTMAELAFEIDENSSALWNIKRATYKPNERIRPKLVSIAREYGLIQGVA